MARLARSCHLVVLWVVFSLCSSDQGLGVFGNNNAASDSDWLQKDPVQPGPDPSGSAPSAGAQPSPTLGAERPLPSAGNTGDGGGGQTPDNLGVFGSRPAFSQNVNNDESGRQTAGDLGVFDNRPALSPSNNQGDWGRNTAGNLGVFGRQPALSDSNTNQGDSGRQPAGNLGVFDNQPELGASNYNQGDAGRNTAPQQFGVFGSQSAVGASSNNQGDSGRQPTGNLGVFDRQPALGAYNNNQGDSGRQTAGDLGVFGSQPAFNQYHSQGEAGRATAGNEGESLTGLHSKSNTDSKVQENDPAFLDTAGDRQDFNTGREDGHQASNTYQDNPRNEANSGVQGSSETRFPEREEDREHVGPAALAAYGRGSQGSPSSGGNFGVFGQQAGSSTGRPNTYGDGALAQDSNAQPARNNGDGRYGVFGRGRDDNTEEQQPPRFSGWQNPSSVSRPYADAGYNVNPGLDNDQKAPTANVTESKFDPRKPGYRGDDDASDEDDRDDVDVDKDEDEDYDDDEDDDDEDDEDYDDDDDDYDDKENSDEYEYDEEDENDKDDKNRAVQEGSRADEGEDNFLGGQNQPSRTWHNGDDFESRVAPSTPKPWVWPGNDDDDDDDDDDGNADDDKDDYDSDDDDNNADDDKDDYDSDDDDNNADDDKYHSDSNEDSQESRGAAQLPAWRDDGDDDDDSDANESKDSEGQPKSSIDAVSTDARPWTWPTDDDDYDDDSDENNKDDDMKTQAPDDRFEEKVVELVGREDKSAPGPRDSIILYTVLIIAIIAGVIVVSVLRSSHKKLKNKANLISIQTGEEGKRLLDHPFV